MANDDPENELGHFRLGQLLMEDGQTEAAIQSFQRTLELSPQFSKVYQLLGSCQIKLNRRDEAVKVLTEGYAVAEERGDNMPREEIAKLLTGLGEPVPSSKKGKSAPGPEGGAFVCQRPGCRAGAWATPLPAPPINDELGKRIQASICADCWNGWLKDYSIKVINEMRLDLSTERGQEVYDQVMMEFLGFQ
jgi:Fe-S cluster biosynthesis and repair protein YggX